MSTSREDKALINTGSLPSGETVKDEGTVDESYEMREFLSKSKRNLERAADSRRRYDYEWMVRDLFERGYQFSRYQPTSQTVVLASRQSAKIPINITHAQMRAIRNQVTSFRPKWEVLPRFTSNESKTQARYTQRLLDYYFDHLKLKKKIKETITQGLKFSVGGPWQIVYDKEKKEIDIWLIDPFDFYVDPYAEELDEAEFVIKAVRQPLDMVLKNPEFDEAAKREITGSEARLAMSEYKQFMIQALKQIAQYTSDDNSTVILFEGYFRIRDKETGKPHLRKMVWTAQNRTPLIWEDLETNEYDFVMYQADIQPKDIYGEGWMKHVMPLNRVLNQLESSVYEYNWRVARGRILVDRDAGVRAIHNTHGEIISKNKGSEVKAMEIPPLPVATSAQIERFWRYLEDVGQVHEASLGRIPTGIKSGVGIQELKQSDSTGQDDLVDNLEDFLGFVAKKVLSKISENYDSYHVIRDLGVREGEEKYFVAVGEQSGKSGSKDDTHKGKVKIGTDWLDLAIIGKDNQVRVTVGSWLGYTKEAMQQKVLDLLNAKAIDQKTFLRLWEFGNIDEIVQETRKEQILQAAMNRGPQQGAQPGEEDQMALATTENQMMVFENKDMPVDPHDDHIVHVIIHQDALGQGKDDLVGRHIAKHQVYMSQGASAGVAQAQAPQTPPPGAAQGPQGGQPQMTPPGANPQTPQGGGGSLPGMPPMGQ